MGEHAVSETFADTEKPKVIFKPIAKVAELEPTAGEKLIQKARASKIGRIVTTAYHSIKKRFQYEPKTPLTSITVMKLPVPTEQIPDDTADQQAA